MIPLQRGIVYGPVRSRRLGLSLGINLLPPGRKHCTMDCLYCQYGWTGKGDQSVRQERTFPTVDEVVSTLSATLSSLSRPPEVLTFSGHGEPTLHPHFDEIVREVLHVRDRYLKNTPTAILSNSLTASIPSVLKGLRLLDHRIMKLDAGREETFQRFNRPAQTVTLDEITDALRSLGRIHLQSLFAGGPGGNDGPEDVGAWVERTAKLSPLEVQVYTLDRGAPFPKITPCSRERLESIGEACRLRGVRVQVVQPSRAT